MKLSKFLKEHNCYDEFVENFDKTHLVENWRWKEQTNKYLLSYCFLWENTKQGNSFWSNIYSEAEGIKFENDMLWLLEDTQKEQDTDAINPNHYKIGGIETIDYMKAKSTKEEFRGHLRLTALKYLSRYGQKDDELQELQKAKWYLDRLIQELEDDTR